MVKNILFACAMGCTVGWLGSTIGLALNGMLNPGSLVGLLLPVGFWGAYLGARATQGDA